MIESITNGFKQLLIHKNIIFYLFFIQLLFAGIIGSSVQSDLQQSIGHTMAGQLFERGFDYSVFTDLSRTLPNAFSKTNLVFFVVFVIYFLLSIFLHAGVIESVRKNQKQTLRQFFSHSTHLFFPFLIIGILFLILFILVTALLFGPISIKALPFVEYLESDRLFFYILYCCLFVYILVLSFLVNWSINSRIHYARERNSKRQSLRYGASWTFRKYIPHTLYFILFLLLGLLVMYINLKLDSLDALVLTFIISLLLLIGRIACRIWYIGTLADYGEALSSHPLASPSKGDMTSG